MKHVMKLALSVALALVACTATAADALKVNGAGASFPYPLYSKWFYEYHRIMPTVEFNYQSIGSGAGIKQITERTVDFGASDAFLLDFQLTAFGQVFKNDGHTFCTKVSIPQRAAGQAQVLFASQGSDGSYFAAEGNCAEIHCFGCGSFKVWVEW